MEPDRDLDLVIRSQTGDRSAYEELVRSYARLVWAQVYGLIHDPAWTEDLVQETFMRGWESIGELKDPAAFRGWLFTIARRLSWRHAEVAGRSPVLEPDAGPAAPVPSGDPEEAREQVQRALARLPERYRIPVTLHYLNGLEYEAISKSLNLANGSLRGLIARGAQKLRAELAPWWRTAHGHS